MCQVVCVFFFEKLLDRLRKDEEDNSVPLVHQFNCVVEDDGKGG